LKLYIQHSIQELQEWFPDVKTELLVRIEARLQEKAKGMFLWVRLVVAMLKDQATEDDLESAIEQLPDGLEEAHGRILLRFKLLSPPLQDRVYRILFWTCAAFRPMRLEEVIDGIALKPGKIVLSKASRVQNAQRDVLDLCAPIIERRQGGILELVHFSAREYLLDVKSGPFIHTGEAHCSIAFSCITNLTSSFVVVQRLSDGQSQQDIERMVVSGIFGLQRYAHDFWSQHVIAYPATVGLDGDYGARFATLTASMESFSRVLKDQSGTSYQLSKASLSAHESECLEKLTTFPRALGLLCEWLSFKKRLAELERTAPDLNIQQQWQLEKDPTFLSLIDYRLASTTETLASMAESDLPAHIDKNDFAAFQAKMGLYTFLCRYRSCGRTFVSISRRNVHELSHTPSFPCLKCDFSGRGFTSRAALEKHVQKYHKSAEDFEIPTSLHLTTNRTVSTQPLGAQLRSRSLDWSTKGREVLQESFNSVYQTLAGLQLGKIDSTMRGSDIVNIETLGDISARPGELQITTLHGSGDTSSLLRTMKDKLDRQAYQTLQEFHTDIEGISRSTDSDGTSLSLQVQSTVLTICDQELERVMNKFPDFSSLDLNDLTTFARGVLVSDAQEVDRNVRTEQMQISDNSATASDQPPPRSAYWSTSEEAEFPRLVQRHGWNFQAIADYYQTKTQSDVEQHYNFLVESGVIPPMPMATQEAASLMSQLELTGRESEGRELQVTIPQETEATAPDILAGPEASLRYGTPCSEPTSQVRTILESERTQATADQAPDPSTWSQHDGQRHLNASNESVEPALGNISEVTRTPAQGPKKYKRRPPKRAFCPYCTEFPDGLSSEHALMRHIKRVHSAPTQLLRCNHTSGVSSSICDACANPNQQAQTQWLDDHLDLQAPESVELEELEKMFCGF